MFLLSFSSVRVHPLYRKFSFLLNIVSTTLVGNSELPSIKFLAEITLILMSIFYGQEMKFFLILDVNRKQRYAIDNC